MSHCKTQLQPSWEFLLSASRSSLQSFKLSRLSHAANLRKEIGQLLDTYVEENSAAMLARLLMEQREQARPGEQASRSPQSAVREEPATKAAASVSDNFLTDQGVVPRRIRGAS
jgi:hypothetical protein